MDTEISKRIKIESSWKAVLLDEFDQEYMRALRRFLRHEQQLGKVIYPQAKQIFSALNLTPFDQVKVVILGQDPYHGPGQAHGLCFSVPPGIALPPSLVNIYKELSSDLAIDRAEHGCLVSWAMQGVLLLNSVLSVEKNSAAAHQGQGWERFTDKIIELINAQTEHVVFILWGGYAQKKGAFIDSAKHLVLQAPHPSPLSAYRGFFGQKPFSRSNEYLQSAGKAPIKWQLPDRATTQKQFALAQEINQKIAES
ncbi:uracil-DNA glycosylase [methanotrophic endosymbiont of Bathymodiolus puteoserpentis (Logatchev)]|jgi:uracil-DNA glycosylase|uniref:uracil-DNA glycosylase n=1 Tax=methanotrophic endosymbiont of Bathymodiolus puteoserpentis (Logatchev) TaxID=343235 RepID=UPI0013C64894|nr:uracil-DNA glycosylase [methanotrophic endosymbiont of Bathymodiolus puteoserpentis (Logatchev)]SHE22370.1 Uracil-DNA glycosylase, family 1 [methanotrophic endosymbiont of Bathymodiolus puteoserpentis (Logatchev)]